MLKTNVLSFATGMAMTLSDRGVRLAAIPDSPLDRLVRCTSTHGLYVDGVDLKDVSLSQVTDYLTERSKMATEGDVPDHDLTTAGLVALAGPAVASQLSLTRNSVMPDIKDVLTQVEATQVGYRNSILEPYRIEQMDRPAVFANPLLAEMVDKFSETAAQDVPRVELIKLDIDGVKALVGTGAEAFDAEMAALLSKEDNIGYLLITDVLRGEGDVAGMGVYAAGLYLVAKALYDNPIDGVVPGLAAFNSALADIIAQSGRVTYQRLKAFDREISQGLLYADASSVGGAVIYVNSQVYLKMLGEGLTPEILIGNELLGRQYMAGSLLENADALTRVYRQEIGLRQLQADIEDVARLKNIVAGVVSKMILERADDVLPQGVGREVLQQRLQSYLQTVPKELLECLPVLARDVVIHVFYAHTDARRIICAVDRIGATQPGISAEEALFLATTQYVAIWVAKQLTRLS